MARVARSCGVPVFFHVRYSDMEPPGTNLDALREVIEAARETGASVHIDHLTSTGGTFSMKQSLDLIQQARDAGIDITADAYPYPYWATFLSSARFDPGWQRRFRITYKDLQLVGSAERLTPAGFARYRRPGKVAVAYAIPEGEVAESLRAPFVMVASDSIPEAHGNIHPRGAGTFARTLAVYVYQRRELSLMEALRKMTIESARRLERAAPVLRRKGRLQVGADADLVVFDPARVRDRATVERPTLYSEGFDYVLVAGKVVKDPRGFRRWVRAGTPVKYAPPPGSACR